jgi:hypothetical protein
MDAEMRHIEKPKPTLVISIPTQTPVIPIAAVYPGRGCHYFVPLVFVCGIVVMGANMAVVSLAVFVRHRELAAVAGKFDSSPQQ